MTIFRQHFMFLNHDCIYLSNRVFWFQNRSRNCLFESRIDVTSSWKYYDLNFIILNIPYYNISYWKYTYEELYFLSITFLKRSRIIWLIFPENCLNLYEKIRRYILCLNKPTCKSSCAFGRSFKRCRVIPNIFWKDTILRYHSWSACRKFFNMARFLLAR